MAGFDNDIVYGTNVDFTGGSPVTGQMVSNGQLLIGASVAPFIRANTLTAGTGISITNGAGTITITNTGGGGGGGGTESLAGNSGSATEVSGVINVVGSSGLTTSGAGQTLTITSTGVLGGLNSLSGTGYVVQTGANTFTNRTFVAGSGISLTNADGVAGATTITASPIVPTTFTEDAGSAVPALNNINIFGTSAQGISTSGAGSTVTITASNASAVQKGVASFNGTNFTVVAGAVSSNAITVTAGTGLTTGGSVNLGGSVTLALDIPVTVPHGGTGQITLTNHGVVIGQAASAVNVTAAGTNGQVLVGGTGVDPAFATVGGTQGVTITGGSNTISIGLVNVPNSALANSSITITGGSGISVSGSPVSLGGSVTISASGTTVTQFTSDSGVAVPSSNNINLMGTAAQGITTSAAGSTVTFTVQNATTAVKGVASFNSSDFTVSSGAVSLLSTGAGKTITGDTGGALSPTANNWNILGQQAGSIAVMDTIGSGSTLSIENRAWLTPLVVDASSTVGLRGTFSTIAAALTAAVSGQTIFIRPGTYTEDITLKAGVNLVAWNADAVTPNVVIAGTCTATFTGTCTLSGIRLQTNGSYFLAVTGSSATNVNLYDCYLNCTNFTGINYTSSSSSSSIIIERCEGDLTTTGIGIYSSSGNGTLFFRYTRIANTGGSTTASTMSDGVCQAIFSRFNSPISYSGTCTGTFDNVTIETSAQNTTSLTTSGTVSITQSYCLYNAGTASAVSVGSGTLINMNSCVVGSTNTNAVTGAGQIRYTPLSFSNTSKTVNVTTQTTRGFGPRILLSGGCEILSGSGSPSGSITAPQGSLYLRTDGTTTNNRAYINTNGGTTWTAITTVA